MFTESYLYLSSVHESFWRQFFFNPAVYLVSLQKDHIFLILFYFFRKSLAIVKSLTSALNKLNHFPKYLHTHAVVLKQLPCQSFLHRAIESGEPLRSVVAPWCASLWRFTSVECSSCLCSSQPVAQSQKKNNWPFCRKWTLCLQRHKSPLQLKLLIIT